MLACSVLLLLVIINIMHSFYHCIPSISKIRAFTNNGIVEESNFNDELYSNKLLYLDSDIIVVDKPPSIQTAPGFLYNHSLAGIIADQFSIQRIDKMIVHRLDYATSGVIMFARNEMALKQLHGQFRSKNKVFKAYISIVSGMVNSHDGIVDIPIGPDSRRGPPFYAADSVSSHAKKSLTVWRSLAYDISSNSTMMELRPQTGRTHQLRLHMAAIGHPIVGDYFYAPPEIHAQGNGRLMLHAARLHVRHPRTNHCLGFYADCPFGFSDLALHR